MTVLDVRPSSGFSDRCMMAPSGRQLHFLILGNDIHEAQHLAGDLKRQGMAFTWNLARNRNEFLAGLGRQVDLVLAYDHLAELHPIEALSLVRISALKIPLIMLSSSANPEMVAEYMKAGAADFLLKNHISRLSSAINDVLEKVHGQEEQRLAFLMQQDNARRSEVLLSIAHELNRQLDLRCVYETICRQTGLAFELPAVCILIYDEYRDLYELAYEQDLSPELRQTFSCLSGSVYDSIFPGSLAGTMASALSSPDPFASLYTHRAASARMLREGSLIGSLIVFSSGGERAFLDSELKMLAGIADQAAQAIVNARLYEEAQSNLEDLLALRDIGQVIVGTVDLSLALTTILRRTVKRLDVDAAAILLFHAASSTLEYSAAAGFHSQAWRYAHLGAANAYASQALVERRMVQISDLRQAPDGFASCPEFLEEEFVGYMALPLISKGQVKGILELFRRSPIQEELRWRDFLDTLCNQAATAIESIQLFEDLQSKNLQLSQSYDTTLEGWAQAMELRDQVTEGHIRRVVDLTIRLARQLGIEDERLAHFRRGAVLHDIGKIAIPDHILFKPGPLTLDEFSIMKRHPIYAYQLLSRIDYLKPSLDIPRYHHEHWDGSGYPDGLHGEQIPLPARIFALADVWDALQSDRPYRKAWSKKQAIEYIQSQSGLHFDPQVVAAFSKLEL